MFIDYITRTEAPRHEEEHANALDWTRSTAARSNVRRRLLYQRYLNISNNPPKKIKLRCVIAEGELAEGSSGGAKLTDYTTALAAILANTTSGLAALQQRHKRQMLYIDREGTFS